MVKIQDIRKKVAPSKTKRNFSQIKKIARHHSATTSGDYLAFWNNRWKGLGWTKGGYHEIILRDGTVQLCYDPIYPTNGVGGHNAYIYNICLVGDGSFTAAQEKAFEERCLLALKNFGISVEDVLGHNEFSGTKTACPGINMDGVRNRLRELQGTDNKEVKGLLKEEAELEFSSSTLRETYEKLFESKATQQMIIDGGIAAGAFGEVWKTRWEKRELAPKDILGLTILKALKD